MEYAQERITTLHDLTDSAPDAPTDRTAVVVPMTEREYAGLAAERVLSTLELVGPGRVVVPLRATPEHVGPFASWLGDFDLPLDVLWCDGPRLTGLLEEHGLNEQRGKGRDVWLALGVASREEFVVVHDADTKTYDQNYVPRLLFPLHHGYDFSKGYYARVENNRLYGRLFRLFFVPLVRALSEVHDAPILSYLGSFRYALAGEFAATSELVRRLSVPRSWGLEVGTLGAAFDHAGFDATAQVDLGTYEHDHRSVGGPTGLSEMSDAVGETLLRVVSERGVQLECERLSEQYRACARTLVDQYATDAAFNGLEYDPVEEREQVDAYATAIQPPEGEKNELPPWTDCPLDAAAVQEAAEADAEEAA
ncbi:MAG: glycosyl transferase family 2 [Halobacteriota archaeon]